MKVRKMNRSHDHMKMPFQVNTQWTPHWNELASYIQGQSESTVYINHMYFPDVARVRPDLPPVFYVQFMREPIARQVSAFYYNMYGPRPKELMEAGRKRNMLFTGLDRPPTINEWVASLRHHVGDGCLATDNISGIDYKFNLQARHFCGFDQVCKNICSKAAIDRAKQVLLEQYTVVGTLEHMGASLELFERLLPRWFSGLPAQYATYLAKNDGHGANVHRTDHEQATDETIRTLKSMLRSDVELYEFAVTTLKEKVTKCLPDSIAAKHLVHACDNCSHGPVEWREQIE